VILPERSFPNSGGIIHTGVIHGADLHAESLTDLSDPVGGRFIAD
jgi:hypothetical protein